VADTLIGGIARRRSIFEFAANFETDRQFSERRETAGAIPSSPILRPGALAWGLRSHAAEPGPQEAAQWRWPQQLFDYISAAPTVTKA
jgi:hypothetical protein